MIDGLKPYPAYKDSGVRWLGEVPEHWQVRRMRNAAEMRVSNVDKHTKDGEHPVKLCNYVDVYKNDRINDSLPFMRATATEEEIQRFRLEFGDVLITKDSESWDDIGVPALVEHSAEDLICGYHLALLRPHDGLLSGGYLFRALQSKPVAYQFHVEANGVTRYGLSHAAIKSTWLPCPPFSEQAAIVRFLDHADRLIRRYVRAKKKLIAALNEQKQAIIHQAVTRGLDPDVKLKPSGIKWLGEVPEHWKIMPLARLLSFGPKNGVSPPPASQNSLGATSFSIAAIRDGKVRIEGNEKRVSLYPVFIHRFRVCKGDILLVRGNGNLDFVARCGLVAECPDHTVYPDIIIKIRPDEQVAAEFMVHAINSRYIRSQVACVAKTTNGAFKISGCTLSALKLAVPPGPEQQQLLDWISTSLNSLDRVCYAASSHIDLIQEYRTRLIADAVTGKLDVREAAAQLPDEAEEPEALNEVEEIFDQDDQAIDESDLGEAAMEADA